MLFSGLFRFGDQDLRKYLSENGFLLSIILLICGLFFAVCLFAILKCCFGKATGNGHRRKGRSTDLMHELDELDFESSQSIEKICERLLPFSYPAEKLIFIRDIGQG